MNLPDIIGLTIIICILLLRYFFDVDTRWLIIVAIGGLLISAGFLAAGSRIDANAAGTVSFYCLAAGVILILLGKVVHRFRGNDPDNRQKDVSFLGTIPEHFKKIKEQRRGGKD